MYSFDYKKKPLNYSSYTAGEQRENLVIVTRVLMKNIKIVPDTFRETGVVVSYGKILVFRSFQTLNKNIQFLRYLATS